MKRAYSVFVEQGDNVTNKSYIVVATGAREATTKAIRDFKSSKAIPRCGKIRVKSLEEISGTVLS